MRVAASPRRSDAWEANIIQGDSTRLRIEGMDPSPLAGSAKLSASPHHPPKKKKREKEEKEKKEEELETKRKV